MIKYESEIYSKIKNIYIQRHAISCANIIEFIFNKEQPIMSKYAPNSKINYLGIQQCLQVSDYFSNFRIDTNNTVEKKPLLIFCCSELFRTQQTIFLSWIKYLKDYKENNGRILIIPWLNEIFKLDDNIILEKDNYPTTLKNTKYEWKKFIENLKLNIEQIKADTINPKSSLLEDINSIKNCKSWEKIFYLSPLIYKEKTEDSLSENGKKIIIKRNGINKKKPNIKQFIKLFNKILANYIVDRKIKFENYNSIQLVFVSHYINIKNLINSLIPTSKNKIKKYNLINCEVLKLPGECLQNCINSKLKLSFECIYPYNKNCNNKFIHPLFIFYFSELNLFVGINNILQNKLKNIKKIYYNKEVKKYLQELKHIKKYLQLFVNIYNKSTFYNYDEMIKKIEEKILFLSNPQKLNKKSIIFKFNNYLFGFCLLDKNKIQSITNL